MFDIVEKIKPAFISISTAALGSGLNVVNTIDLSILDKLLQNGAWVVAIASGVISIYLNLRKIKKNK